VDFVLCGLTQVQTSPYYPQSKGKIERWQRTLKGDCIRTETPLSLEDAQRIVVRYVEYDNNARLHSAIGYITPTDKLEGREKAIFAERDRKLAKARERRKAQRQATRQAALATSGPEPTMTVT
jgi:putative transposase